MQLSIGGVITISSGTDRKRGKRARKKRRAGFSVLGVVPVSLTRLIGALSG